MWRVIMGSRGQMQTKRSPWHDLTVYWLRHMSYMIGPLGVFTGPLIHLLLYNNVSKGQNIIKLPVCKIQHASNTLWVLGRGVASMLEAAYYGVLIKVSVVILRPPRSHIITLNRLLLC